MEVSNKESKSIVEFTIEELKENLNDGGNIVVPPYQRGISWKKYQQENLIDSLINEYPFGCLLLYETENEQYKIIDGLQRSYTVIDFYDNPLNYFNEKYLSEEDINKVSKLTKDEDIKENIRVKLPNMIKEYVLSICTNINDLKNLDVSQLVFNIIEEWQELLSNTNNIKNIIKNITDKFCKNYEKICNNLKIPAIIFKAPEEKLPEIFERINSEGSKLTKYQIYAATWSDDKVVIDNKSLQDIITNVKNRYDSYLKDIGTLDGYDSVKLTRTKEISIFDMIYGFGKMICKEYPNLFTYETDITKVESIGFNLINACLLQKSSNMKNLNLTIKKHIGYNSQNIANFLLNIIECIKYVNKKLSRGINFKGNKNQDINTSPLHTELQIVSIISSLFIAKHIDYKLDEDGNIKKIFYNKVCNTSWTKSQKSKFDSNILKIYSIDLIGSKWRGSGDSKLYNILTNKTYYMRKITWDEFKVCLDTYFNTQKTEKNERTKVANPSSPDKLILNLIYSSILSAKDQLDDSGYDIEHLATKSIMKSKIQKYDDPEFSLPISSIGNLCLLPKEYNGKKGEKVIYQFTEYYDQDSKKIIKIPISKYEKLFTFTKESDFDWLIKDKENEALEFKLKYEDFLNNRFKLMKNKIKKSLFQNE